MTGSSSRRSRSPSPSRRPPKPSRGFRWKESRPSDSSHDSRGSRRDFQAQRDYRSRSQERNRDRDRDRDRERGNDRYDRHDRSDRYDRYDRHSRHDRRDDRPRSRSPRRHDSAPKDKGQAVKQDKKDKDTVRDKKDKKPSKAAAAIGPGQELIVVNVNDRLGTKTAIPCLPSDTIAQFKLMLAARIGRDPGQIMLRRQGERPFKDPLTLEDYGISNGVQLDLEIDTGD